MALEAKRWTVRCGPDKAGCVVKSLTLAIEAAEIVDDARFVSPLSLGVFVCFPKDLNHTS